MCDFLDIDKAKWGEHGMNFLEEKVINAIVLLGLGIGQALIGLSLTYKFFCKPEPGL
ncbi:transmembrane protein, putative [Medicago truncatula]|uniref:Transmembrane protein, putative n=1 Tax=Medicago truncatula TaxID=3880 RepID=A0A072VGG0_MEDTR|nr:transmembrane protein, putative [Medicago truncatula]